MTMYVDKINLSAYASDIGTKEPLKISAEARGGKLNTLTLADLPRNARGEGKA